MSSHLRVSLKTAWAVLLVCAGALGQVQTWKQVPVPPLPAFKPVQPRRIQLANGMVIFLQEDHELPLIDGVARIRGGSRAEPREKTGLVDLYGQVWRTGGTAARTGDQLDDFLEARAAKVETGGGSDSTTIAFSCLKQDFGDIFNVFLEVLRQPSFRVDKLELAKGQMNSAISRRNDDVEEIASRESVKLAYGSDNPYAREPEYATIAAVNRDDLLQWHQQHVHPNNIIFGIVGDFDGAQVEARLREAFGSWPAGPRAPEPDIEFHPANPGYYLVAKNDVDQSVVRMVGLGTTRRNPDYYAIEVFNEAFAGGFSSRLVSDIRTRQGLAYSVGGGIGANFDHPGIVRIGLGTKSQNTVRAIRALETEIRDLRTHPITEQELKRAQDSILNSFVFNFDSPGKVLRERLAYEFYGYPPDFLERFRAGIEKVTVAQLARVPEKYIHADQLAVLVAGNEKEFDQPLSTLGAVTPLDITIPGSPTQVGPAQPAAEAKPAASNPEGKELMAKVVTAMGGEAKVASVHSLQEKMTQTMQGPAGDVTLQVEATIVFPDRVRASIKQGEQTMTIVSTPDSAFMVAPGSVVEDLPASQREELLQQLKRDPLFVAQHVSDPHFVFAAGASVKIGDVDARLLNVSADGTAVQYYVEPGSGRILRESYSAVGSSGPFQGETDLSDWKTVDGLTLPAKHVNKQNGKVSSTVDVLELQLNPPIDGKLFERPPH